jgi:hypothetical protein
MENRYFENQEPLKIMLLLVNVNSILLSYLAYTFKKVEVKAIP